MKRKERGRKEGEKGKRGEVVNLQFLVGLVSGVERDLYLGFLEVKLLPLCGQLSPRLLQLTLQSTQLALESLRTLTSLVAGGSGLGAESRDQTSCPAHLHRGSCLSSTCSEHMSHFYHAILAHIIIS